MWPDASKIRLSPEWNCFGHEYHPLFSFTKAGNPARIKSLSQSIVHHTCKKVTDRQTDTAKIAVIAHTFRSTKNMVFQVNINSRSLAV